MTLKQLINITSYEIVDKYVEKAIISEREIKDSEELYKRLENCDNVDVLFQDFLQVCICVN